MNKKLIIAIDGPAGSGKSTAAKKLSDRLNYTYIDTGAMYRSVALKCIQQSITLDDETAISALARNIEISFLRKNGAPMTILDGKEVTSLIRDEPVGLAASRISMYRCVRETLTRKQQDMGALGGVVMEGRDIGTVVFPDADLKIFLKATAEERAKRRYAELKERNSPCDYEAVLSQIKERDAMDQGRAIAPLKPAKNARIIDTTHLSFDEVVESMIKFLV